MWQLPLLWDICRTQENGNTWPSKMRVIHVMCSQKTVDTDRVSAPEAVILKHVLVSQAQVTEHWLIFCHRSLLPVGFLQLAVMFIYQTLAPLPSCWMSECLTCMTMLRTTLV